MQISSSRITPKHTPQTANASAKNESITFLNEPHVPMDAVMRGYSQMDFSSVKDALAFAAFGAAGGAAAGALTGGNGWMAPPAVATTAAAATAGTALDLAINGDDGYGNLALLASPIAGAGAGIAGGLIGFGLTALTGMNPIAAGAVGGAVGGAALAFISN